MSTTWNAVRKVTVIYVEIIFDVFVYTSFAEIWNYVYVNLNLLFVITLRQFFFMYVIAVYVIYST